MPTIVYRIKNLRGNRNRDLRGLFAGDAADADRTGHTRKPRRIQTPRRARRVSKLRRLVAEPIRPNHRQKRRAPDLFAQFLEVKRVIVGHHQEIAAAAQRGIDLGLGRVGLDTLDPGTRNGKGGGQHAVATYRPGSNAPTGKIDQARAPARYRRTGGPNSVSSIGLPRDFSACDQSRCRVERFEHQGDQAAAALAETGAERETTQAAIGAVGSSRLRAISSAWNSRLPPPMVP